MGRKKAQDRSWAFFILALERRLELVMAMPLRSSPLLRMVVNYSTDQYPGLLLVEYVPTLFR